LWLLRHCAQPQVLILSGLQVMYDLHCISEDDRACLCRGHCGNKQKTEHQSKMAEGSILHCKALPT
jgi:hypothetical protein